eukprot:3936556-Rhodomonas_salina.1
MNLQVDLYSTEWLDSPAMPGEYAESTRRFESKFKFRRGVKFPGCYRISADRDDLSCAAPSLRLAGSCRSARLPVSASCAPPCHCAPPRSSTCSKL